MSPRASDIRPETQALDTLIRRTVSQVRQTATDKAADAILFLGNWHHAFPSILLQDPILEPVDKVVWMVVCQQGQAAGTSTAFPSYKAISRQANIASTSTISRAVAILRATRWLSLCARVRDGSGRFHGNVYALHDEPIPLVDALHLDPDYMTFVNAACQHHHARVRKVAEGVLESLDEDIGAGREVLAPVPAMDRRLEALRAVREAGPRRYFSFSASVVSRLANRAPVRRQANRHQKSKADTDRLRTLSPQKSKSGGSSSYINTTTTTIASENARDANENAGLASLIYPARLTANQREIAARYLATVSMAQRQSVLDELEGRFRAEKEGAKPVYNELRYLHHLCAQVRAGGFQANLSLKVQGERERRAQEAEKRRQADERRDEERRHRQRTRKASGESPLAEARKILGLPPSNHAPTRNP